MGQKVNPRGFRIGVTESWQSRWFAGKDFARFIGEDRKIRIFLKKKLEGAGISKIEIERAAARVRISIFTAKPGLVIGKKGKEIDDMRGELKKLVGKEVSLNIVEIRKPDLDAQLVAENIAAQLEKRINYRRAVKEGISRALRAGAEGVKVGIGGRIGGNEIARREKYKDGRVPAQTLRADIDYGFAEAHTSTGLIGIKTWVFKGEKFSPGERVPVEAMQL